MTVGFVNAGLMNLTQAVGMYTELIRYYHNCTANVLTYLAALPIIAVSFYIM